MYCYFVKGGVIKLDTASHRIKPSNFSNDAAMVFVTRANMGATGYCVNQVNTGGNKKPGDDHRVSLSVIKLRERLINT